MFALILTVLCLISVGYSDTDCDKLVQPFTDYDPQNMLGRWALVAHSMNQTDTTARIEGKDSLTVFFHNDSYVLIPRVGDHCEYYHRQSQMQGHTFHVHLERANITGTVFRTKCPDCAMMTVDVESAAGKKTDLFLFSKRREIEDPEMEEFKAQVKCLHMPEPFVMDPKKNLCPETKEEVKPDAPAAA